MKKQSAERSTLGMPKTWIYSAFRATFALLLTISLALPVVGQNLSEFKSRASRTGVDAIPYSSLRSTAERAEDDKDDAYDEAKSKFGYEALKLKKRQAENDLKKAKEKLEDAEDAYEEQKRYLPDDTDDQEEAVKKAKEAVADVEERLDDIEDEISNGERKWREVATLRGKVREAFDDVEDELEESKDRPENHIGRKPTDPDDLEEWEEDREELNGYIDKILAHIRSQKAGHKTAEDQAKRTADNISRL